MSFADQPFASRFAQMGDQAEAKFEEWAGGECKGFVRFGLNRPPLHMASLPTRLRYAPDYLCTDGFYEVQGFGKKQQLQLKVEKWSCLNYWNTLHPVHLFLYDSHNDRSTVVGLAMVQEWLDYGKATIGHFPEPKTYFAVSADDVFATEDVAA